MMDWVEWLINCKQTNDNAQVHGCYSTTVFGLVVCSVGGCVRYSTGTLEQVEVKAEIVRTNE